MSTSQQALGLCNIYHNLWLSFATGMQRRLSEYHIAGIFCSVKVLFFSFCTEQERKLDVHFLRQNGRGLSVIRENGIKTEKNPVFHQKNETLSRQSIPTIRYQTY